MFAMRAAVALHAVVEIGNAFAQVLRPDRVGLMLVASKTSVTAGVVVDMASCAGHVMIAVQQEELLVVDLRRLPSLRAVTLPTILAHSAVDRRVGRRMARRAFRAGRRQKQIVRERCATAQRKRRSFMPPVACHAILRAQLLVERGLGA